MTRAPSPGGPFAGRRVRLFALAALGLAGVFFVLIFVAGWYADQAPGEASLSECGQWNACTSEQDARRNLPVVCIYASGVAFVLAIVLYAASLVLRWRARD